MRRIVCVTMALAGLGCAHTVANSPLSDGTVVHLDGYGVEAQVSLTCLTADQINQLTGGSTPPTVAPASCYETAIITSKSSQISNAITAYLQAQKNLSNQVTSAVAPGATPATADPVAKAAAGAIVADVVTGHNAAANAAALKMTLSSSTRTAVVQELNMISAAAVDSNRQLAIKAASDALK